MLGARVIIKISLGDESVILKPIYIRLDTKIYEVWVILGYGLIGDFSRSKRIKRNFYRACKHTYKYGYI